MLADPETSEGYDLLAKTRSALTPVPAPDIAATVGKNITADDTIVAVVKVPVEAHEIIIFDNEPLATIAIRIAEYNGCKVELSAKAEQCA